MTRDEAMGKLTDRQKRYCEALSGQIETAKKIYGTELTGIRYDDNVYRHGKIRGFLECLEEMGVIDHTGMCSLYFWYVTKGKPDL